MNRLGLNMAEAQALIPRIQQGNHGFTLVMSHLAAAEALDNPLNGKQLGAFREIARHFTGVPASLSNSSGIFLGPTYGISSEIAATGPNGPSIFPSTALGLRANLSIGDHGYVRAAVLNAHSGVLGDPKGVDLTFDDGVLTIAQVGVDGDAKIGVGAWRYSRKQDDIRDVDVYGAPVQVAADGAYLLAEHPLFGDEGKAQGTAFLRVGVSDARTTPFRGGWQAGLHIVHPIASRPDSELAFGVQQGLLSQRFRANLRDTGVDPKTAESGVEITYADKLTSRVTVQPDLQWARLADAPRDADSRWIATLRVRVELGSQP